MLDIAYTAHATSTGAGRSGHVRTDDGRVDLDMAPPVAMGGSGEGANPELLFAAGYAACFHGALQVVAREARQDLGESKVEGAVSIGKTEAGGFGLAVTLTITIPTVDEPTARDLVEQAHRKCPYSQATQGNIDVDLEVATS